MSSIMREKRFNQSKQLMTPKNDYNTTRLSFYIILLVLSFLLFTFFPWRETIVYTPIQGTNREKYFNHIIHKRKMPTLAVNKHLSVHFIFHRLRLFHPSPEICTGLIPEKWTSKWFFPHRHKN